MTIRYTVTLKDDIGLNEMCRVEDTLEKLGDCEWHHGKVEVTILDAGAVDRFTDEVSRLMEIGLVARFSGCGFGEASL